MQSEEGLDNKHSIIFCGLDSYQNRDLHSEAKKAGFNPVYSMKHPSVKVVMKRSSLRK
tara:strand:- start:6293 stop:6466 length:174 start_codon:yes stop_codon:yes gene_type:complete